MSDALSETPSKSGLVLKAAREELSLSLDQVAHELHLRPSVVKAIEDEDYDEFSSDVFLKGYFRSYCRLVNLHDARMMELLDQQLLIRKQQAEHAEQKITKITQSKKRKKLLVTLLVFVVCLSLVAFTYYVTSKDETKVSKLVINERSLPVITESDVLASGAESSRTALDQAQLNDAETLVEETTYSDNGLLVTPDLLENPEQTTASTLSAEETKLTETKLTETASNVDALPSESLLTAKFSGDCWFKLIDNTGKVVIADLKNENDEVSFSGNTPFHIVIGDASKISLTLNQKLIDLSPYTSRNGRAELTLNQSKVVNEG
tara:strand:+ start:8451 stop:9410 length:960 start_codon:yes stop_codon:yes gene_type:complete